MGEAPLILCMFYLKINKSKGRKHYKYAVILRKSNVLISKTETSGFIIFTGETLYY